VKRFATQARRGFSLVELLAVVLILAVLAAVAIPLYINTRRSAAARACKGNLAAIASAQSAYALRNGSYAPTQAGLVGQPEGLSVEVRCPLTNTTNYTHTVTAGALTLTCPNASEHILVVPPVVDYTRTMAAPAAENIP
jgi:prepilin-type N-terminal cleavage/methylation domain-containing protein